MKVAENIQYNKIPRSTAFVGALWALGAQNVPKKPVDSVLTLTLLMCFGVFPR